MKHIIKRLKNKHRKSKTLGIKTEKRKAVGGDCKESNIEEKSARKYSRRWDIIVTAFDFVTNFSESSISAYAGQAAFFLMLSFFPFYCFLFAAELDTAYRG